MLSASNHARVQSYKILCVDGPLLSWTFGADLRSILLDWRASRIGATTYDWFFLGSLLGLRSRFTHVELKFIDLHCGIVAVYSVSTSTATFQHQLSYTRKCVNSSD